MKNPLEFSSRRTHEKSGSDLDGLYSSHKREFFNSSVLEPPAKLNFRNDSTELHKRRSPDHTRSFLESRTVGTGQNQAAVISHLKSQLSTLKHEVSKLTNVNIFEPLQFKPRSKLDKTMPTNGYHHNNSTESKLDEYMIQPRNFKAQEEDLKKEFKRLKSQYGQESSHGSDSTSKEPHNRLQTLKSKKQQDELKEQLEKSKNTCREFKEQAQRLREQLRQASDRERKMLEDKKQLLERLNFRKSDQLKEDYQKRIQSLLSEHAADKARLQTIRIAEGDNLRRLNMDLERVVDEMQHRLQDMDNEQKQAASSWEDLLRRREKEISILKQEIAILQQLTSTRIAEQNCLQLQKESVERMCHHKDSENKKLQKDITDLKERLESERNFNFSINEKLGMKNLMIQSLEGEVEKLRESLSTLKWEASHRQKKTLQRNRILNLQIAVRQDVEKLAAKPQILERRRTCTTQTTSPLFCQQCINNENSASQENEHKENLQQPPRLKYYDALFDSRMQKSDRSAYELRSSNSSKATPRKDAEPPASPQTEARIQTDREVNALKAELNGTYLQLLQAKAENCKLNERLLQFQNEIARVTAQSNSSKQEIAELNSAAINAKELYQAQVKALTDKLEELKVKVHNLTAINQQLHIRNEQLSAELESFKAKQIGETATVIDACASQTETNPLLIEIDHLRAELDHCQRQLHDTKVRNGNLQHHLDNLNRKLRRTEDTLHETNDIVHRMNLSRLAARLEQCVCD